MSELQKCLDEISKQIGTVKNELTVLESMYNEVVIQINSTETSK